MNPEIRRVLELPRRDLSRLDVDLTDKYKRLNGEQRLRPIQSLALYEIETCGGLLGPIGVGLGKSLIAFLAPVALKAENTVLLVPAGAYSQVLSMYAEAQQHWKVATLTIVPYSQIQVESGADLFGELAPDCIVADEAHFLKNWKSARGGRLVRYFQEHPDTRFVALSGTMTVKSLLDYAHLSELALREGSPLPRDKWTLESWARVIDAGERPLPQDWSSVRPLCSEKSQKAVRKAFQDRLISTPGVICSSDDDVKSSLRIIRHHDLPFPFEIYQATMGQDGERPDGTAFEADVDQWRCQRQLSLGFYYYWDWGDRDPDWEYVDKHNAWGRAVRAELRYNARKFYDSPKLVANAIEAGRVDGHLAETWRAWKAIRSRPGPQTVPKWTDERPIQALLALAKRKTCLIWYESIAVHDRLVDLGVNVVSPGDPVPLDTVETLALSIRSHGTAWNLQPWSVNIVLEPPPTEQPWEQMIGRTHRVGQTADTVRVHIPYHTGVFIGGVQKAQQQARYVQETQGLPRRLVYADYEDR